MKYLLLFLIASSFLVAEETSGDQQAIEQLRIRVIETMRESGPEKVGDLIKKHLETSTDAKAVFYLAWNYYNVGEFETAELYARPLTVTSDPSVQAAANLLLGKIYSVFRSDKNNPVYYLTAALLISQEHNLLKVEFRTHLVLVYWYSEQKQHDLSELHLRKAQSFLEVNEFDSSKYYMYEYFHLMSLGAYREAKKSALLMYEAANSKNYKPYYAINLAIIQILLREFDQAEIALRDAKAFFDSRGDSRRLEVIEVLFECINFCQNRKNSLQTDSFGAYSTDSDVPHLQMMGRYIRLIYNRCR